MLRGIFLQSDKALLCIKQEQIAYVSLMKVYQQNFNVTE